MSEFDPALPAMVHDRLNDRTFLWPTGAADAYRRNAREIEPGVISFDGQHLDGWEPLGQRRPWAR
jgi:hypothetical protein